MKPGALSEPSSDPGVFVSAVVVADQMDIEVGGNICLDVPQETQELLCRCCALHWVSTLPLAISSAANNVVVP
jgi:hypothetical protein